LRRIGFRRPKTDKKYGMVAISEEFSMVAVDILHERQAGCYDFGGIGIIIIHNSSLRLLPFEKIFDCIIPRETPQLVIWWEEAKPDTSLLATDPSPSPLNIYAIMVKL